jgi:hypothetical protein
MQADPDGSERRTHSGDIGVQVRHRVNPLVVLRDRGGDIASPTVAEYEDVGWRILHNLCEHPFAHQTTGAVGIVPAFHA